MVVLFFFCKSDDDGDDDVVVVVVVGGVWKFCLVCLLKYMFVKVDVSAAVYRQRRYKRRIEKEEKRERVEK